MLAVDSLLQLYDLPARHGHISAFTSHDHVLFVGTSRGHILQFIVENSPEDTASPTRAAASAHVACTTPNMDQSSTSVANSFGKEGHSNRTCHARSPHPAHTHQSEDEKNIHDSVGTDTLPCAVSSSCHAANAGVPATSHVRTTLVARVTVCSSATRTTDRAVTQLQRSPCCPLLFVLCEHRLTVWHAHTLQPLSVVSHIPITRFDSICASRQCSHSSAGGGGGDTRRGAESERRSHPAPHGRVYTTSSHSPEGGCKNEDESDVVYAFTPPTRLTSLSVSSCGSARSARTQHRHVVCAAEHQSRGLAVFELTVIVSARTTSVRHTDTRSKKSDACAGAGKPNIQHGHDHTVGTALRPCAHREAHATTTMKEESRTRRRHMSTSASAAMCECDYPTRVGEGVALRCVPRKAVLIQQLRLPEPVLALTMMTEFVVCVGTLGEYRWVNVRTGATRRALRRRTGAMTCCSLFSTSSSSWCTGHVSKVAPPHMARGARNSLYLCDGAAVWVTFPRRGGEIESTMHVTAAVNEDVMREPRGEFHKRASGVGNDMLAYAVYCEDEEKDMEEAKEEEEGMKTDDMSLTCWSPVRPVLIAEDLIHLLLVHFPFVFVFTSDYGDVYSAYHTHTRRRHLIGPSRGGAQEGHPDTAELERTSSLLVWPHDRNTGGHSLSRRACTDSKDEKVCLEHADNHTSSTRKTTPRVAEGSGAAHGSHDDTDEAAWRKAALRHGGAAYVTAMERLPVLSCRFATVLNTHESHGIVQKQQPHATHSALYATACSSGVFLTSHRSVWLAQVHTLRHQLADLVEQDSLAAAFALLRDAETTPEMTRELCIMSGFACLHRARMRKAMDYFAHHLDPRELLLHLPECIPAQRCWHKQGKHTCEEEDYWAHWSGVCVYNDAVGRLGEVWAQSATCESGARCWADFKLALEHYLSVQLDRMMGKASWSDMPDESLPPSCRADRSNNDRAAAAAATRKEKAIGAKDRGNGAAAHDTHALQVVPSVPHDAGADLFSSASPHPISRSSSSSSSCFSAHDVSRPNRRVVFASRGHVCTRTQPSRYSRLSWNRQRVIAYALLVLAQQRRDHRRVYALVRYVPALHVCDAAPLLSAQRDYRLLALLLHVRHDVAAAARVWQRCLSKSTCPAGGGAAVRHRGGNARDCASHVTHTHAESPVSHTQHPASSSSLSPASLASSSFMQPTAAAALRVLPVCMREQVARRLLGVIVTDETRVCGDGAAGTPLCRWWEAVMRHYRRATAAARVVMETRVQRFQTTRAPSATCTAVRKAVPDSLTEAWYLIDAMDAEALRELLRRRGPGPYADDEEVDVCACDEEGNSLLHAVSSLLLRHCDREEEEEEEERGKASEDDERWSWMRRARVVLVMLTLLVQAGAPTDRINAHGQSCVDVLAEADGGRWLDVAVITLLAAVSLRSSDSTV